MAKNTPNNSRFTRRDALKVTGIALLAGAAGAGVGTAIDEQNKQELNSKIAELNNPDPTKVAEVQASNKASEAITPTTTDATPTYPTTYDPSVNTEAEDTPENLPDTTTPHYGAEPKNYDPNKLDPFSIRIPIIKFNAELQYTGGTYNPKTGRTEINIPVTFRIGVYTDSAPLTSDKGTTLLVGHVNWSNGAAAPMSAITYAKLGNTVLTSDLNGTITTWEVTRIEPKVPQVDLSNWWDVTNKTGERQLIMATCSGTLVNGRWTYTDNYVVVAKPKK